MSCVQFFVHSKRITVNVPTRAALEEDVRRRFEMRQGFALATVNLDHLVKMKSSQGFTRAYAAQDLVVADGWPIVALSRLARRPVDLMPGSDLIVPLCDLAAECGIKVGLLGSSDESLAAARIALCNRIPALEVAYTHAPPMGFDPTGPEAEQQLHALQAAGIGLCLLALGAPKQEELAARGRQLAPSVGFASIGAGLDFLSGHQHRAPRWTRRIGLEWLWRAFRSPRRMVPRYARCFTILPEQMIRALRLRP